MACHKGVFSPQLFSTYTPTINQSMVEQELHLRRRPVHHSPVSFSQVESTIKEAVRELTEYYRNNSLGANPDKTHVTAFHLRNREANRSLKVSWNGVDLENTIHPKYLGVTLDRKLSYIQHTKMKVATRNNLLKKLANSKLRTNAITIRTTALAMYYSIAEYAAPVWARSTYADILDPKLNKACQAITGCLKPTYAEDLYLLAGIASPDIRRDVCARMERTKQMEQETHSLFGHIPVKVVQCNEWQRRLLLLYAFRDLWKEWGDSNFQIFSQNCQLHHMQLESLEHFNVILYISF